MCSQCSSSYHHQCVQINDMVENWICPTCSKSHLKVPDAPSVKNSSRQSKVSSARQKLYEDQKRLLDEQEQLLAKEIEMKKKAAQEEAKLFEEMMKNRQRSNDELQKTMDKQKELLEEKKKLIDETVISLGSSSSSSRSRKSVVQSKKKVEQWMQNVLPQHANVVGDSIPVAADGNHIVNICQNVPLPKVIPPRDLPFLAQESIRNHPMNSTERNKHLAAINEATQLADKPDDGQKYVPAPMDGELTKNQIAARHVVKQLPTFDGNPKDWSRFLSSFERSTMLCGYSNDENLERLRHSLKGSAIEAVESRLTSGRVAHIISDLKSLFGRPEFIINELLKNLRQEQSPSIDNIDSMIRYSFQIENICAAMQDAKLSEYLWDPNLLKEMETKLPMAIKLDWASYKHLAANKVNFEVFSMWLKARSTSYMSILSSPPNLLRPKSKAKGFTNVHDAKDSCVICDDGEHLVEKCAKFQTLSSNERWSEVKKNSLCRQCLKFHRKRCVKNQLCQVDGCQSRHHYMLHNQDKTSTSRGDYEINNHTYSQSGTYFKILPVKLYNGSIECDIYAILDDCSSVTLLDSEIAKNLNVHGEAIPLCLKWTNGVQRRENNSQLINLQVSSADTKKRYKLHNVRTVDNLRLPEQTVNMEELKSCNIHLRDVPFSSYTNERPRLLIGLKHSKLHEVSRYCSSGNDSPSACKTALGWVVYGGGNMDQEEKVHHVNECNCRSEHDLRLETLVRENYSLDSIGVSNPEILPISTSDQKAYDILKSTTNLQGDRYEVGLLWKFDHINLPKSFQMAVKRHQCLEKRGRIEPQLLEIIDSQIQEYVKKGYASEVSEWSKDDVHCWYLPIFVVKNPNKPNKIRLVWDAAATVGGISLNTVLLKGPDLVASLPAVLQRFRQYEVAFSGDIKEMFHQIKIRKQDRQYQRFLWRKSPEEDLKVYVMNVMTFGATCSPSCAQFIKNENAERFRVSHPSVVEVIKCNHYVDDWLQSVPSVDVAIKLAEEVKFVHSKGGFEIRNWTSNSKEVKTCLQGISSEVKDLDLSSVYDGEKVLGMCWETTPDVFVFSLRFNNVSKDILSGERAPTKREVLRLLMSVFDPLGLLSHVLIFLKILMQQIWRSKVEWDQQINQEHFDQFKQWMDALPSIKRLKIPRWIGLSSSDDRIEMHTFTDASEDAYAAVVYFKIFIAEAIRYSLVTSKSRVSPLKALSIPRLELQAAVLGTRLSKSVETNHNHPISRRFFWSDSQTVLKWLYSDTKKYTQFVSCRVGEILEASSASDWNWVEGKQNVADLATKMKIPEISLTSPWFQGPENIKDQDSVDSIDFDEPTQEELREQYLCVQQEVEFRIEKWLKLRRVIAYILRYINNLLLKSKQLPLESGPLKSNEYKKAEIILFKRAQKEGYAEEYMKLERGGKITDKRSVIYKDSAYIDESGVMRSRSRIGDAPYTSFDTRRPIILPKENRITEMILQSYHEKYGHQYPSTVMNEVKQRFSIPRLRVKLRSIRNACQVCKNSDAKPQMPEEAELPAARLTSFTRPFTFIGIDYFGPTLVVVGRRHEKRWCMLITCLTTRGLHLEVVHTLSTNSCILGLRRFISRRGTPKEIYTDNGTNFRGSKRELREIWDHIDKNKVAESFISSDTEWKFIPPASPHMGGAWERMVRSVKTSLKSSLPSLRIPSDELLLTMLAEVEDIINSRPLTYVALGNEDEEALTPNHFILGSSSGMKQLGEFNDECEVLRQNWHKAQQFANTFWRRWMKEYLPTLCRRTKWISSNAKEPLIGDIVIIVGEEKRNDWPKGKILDVHRGRDKKVRSVTVQLSTGIYVRPVSKIAILDVLDRNVSNSSCIPGGSVTNNDFVTIE